MPDPRDVVANIYTEFAHELADAAAAAILPHFRRRVAVDAKHDGTPVTQADREAEEAIRGRIEARFPAHGIVGEEFGAERSDAEWVWVLDPIDGTGAFISGLPTFGTLIGLLHNGSPVLGVLNQPVSEERWIGLTWPGQVHRATLRSGASSQQIHTLSTARLHEAVGFATSPDQFAGAAQQGWDRLRGALARVRYGVDCYAYGLLAAGCIDVVAEASLKPWDCLPLVPIVAGAGGVMTTWAGEPLSLERADRVLAAATRDLHSAAMQALAEPPTR